MYTLSFQNCVNNVWLSGSRGGAQLEHSVHVLTDNMLCKTPNTVYEALFHIHNPIINSKLSIFLVSQINECLHPPPPIIQCDKPYIVGN